MLRLLAAIAALALLSLQALPAAACGALPDAHVTIASSSPGDGETDFPLDAPLIFDVRCEVAEAWPSQIVRDAACNQFGDQLVLELRAEGAEQPLPGEARTVQGKLVFLPSAALQPNTLYRVSARVRALPSDALGAPTELSFRTGSERLPALVSAAAPSVTLESYEAQVLQCDRGELVGDAARDYLTPQICPSVPYSDCREAGVRPALRYRIAVGALSGGDERLPYVLEALLTDATPGAFDTPPQLGIPSEDSDGKEHTLWTHRAIRVPAGESGELFFDAPSGADDPEHLCVRWRVFDSAGHLLTDAGRCEDRAARSATGGAEANESAGCRVSPGAAGSQRDSVWMLCAAALVLRGCRRAFY